MRNPVKPSDDKQPTIKLLKPGSNLKNVNREKAAPVASLEDSEKSNHKPTLKLKPITKVWQNCSSQK